MLIFSIPQFFFLAWVMVVSLQMHGHRSCIRKERIGLLALKAYVNSSFSYDWPSDTNSNCCRWQRVECDPTSGRVIGLFLNYTWSSRPLLNLSLFYPFQELKTLDLNTIGCTSWFDDIHGYKSLKRFKKLEILDFGDNFNIVIESVLPFLGSVSSLKTLILHGNSLEGNFPIQELKNLRNLRLLDLSGNMFIGPLPGEGLSYFRKLQALDLSDNKFSGSLENEGLCQLQNLQELDLSQNKLSGQFPQCFGSLTKLQVLDVSSNQFNGTVPSFISKLGSLEYLSLSDNEFEGSFSFNLIANLSNLQVFKLSSRSSRLHIKTEISWQPKFQLKVIQLQYCNLETVPIILQLQKNLRLINLSNNKLTGAFPSWLLEQNPKLGGFFVQNNSFTMLQLTIGLNHSLRVLDISTNEFSGWLHKNIGKVLPNLRHLNISTNRFQGNLPSSLGEMKNVFFLDLSYNNFSGSLPRNFRIGCESLDTLKLSYNSFSGQIFSHPTNLVSLSMLLADNNLFTQIADGLLSTNLGTLDLSNNYLQGVIPSWLGGVDFTNLFLSGNLLEGTVPSIFFNILNIYILDLSRNKFSGNLPSHFRGSSMLFLNDNEFTGEIPSTLLRNSVIIDLRNNKLSGNIPRFPSDQSVLSLLLRGNRLTGHIPKEICGLSSIKILDLANNRLNGSIPSCLNNVSFGRTSLGYNDIFYISSSSYTFGGTWVEKYSRSSLILPHDFFPNYSGKSTFVVEFVSKSRFDFYTERSFNFMFGLDLSNNELSGTIPRELGDLHRIRALNLSHNSLSGLIPESFSNLTDMESLDLSSNMLHGPIPQDLTKLHYLVVINVSHNNLSGSIPSQGKFLTLSGSNYIGNPLLCGSPVDRSCDTNIPKPDCQGRDDEMTIDLETFYWSLAATYGVAWVAFIVFICFDSPWRRAWFRLVDTFINLFKCA